MSKDFLKKILNLCIKTSKFQFPSQDHYSVPVSSVRASGRNLTCESGNESRNVFNADTCGYVFIVPVKHFLIP